MATQEPEFYTVDEVATRLRVNPRTVYRLIERRQLRAVRVGDLYRIRRSDLEAFIEDGGTEAGEG